LHITYLIHYTYTTLFRSKRSYPQHGGRPFERRLVKHEIAVARDEVGAHLLVAFALFDLRAYFVAQIFRQVGVRIGQGLVLADQRSEEHTSELQSRSELVC